MQQGRNDGYPRRSGLGDTERSSSPADSDRASSVNMINDSPLSLSFPSSQSSSSSSSHESGGASDYPPSLLQRFGTLFYNNRNGGAPGTSSSISNSARSNQSSDASSTLSSATRSSFSSIASGRTNIQSQMGSALSFGSASSSSSGSVISFTGGHLTTIAGNMDAGNPYTPVMIHNHANGVVYISPHTVNNGEIVPIPGSSYDGGGAHDEAIRQMTLAREEYNRLREGGNQQP